LGSTGASGVKYAPNSYLATLPPDSGFMKVAAELGWIGLLLFCGLLFTILRQGILNYYLIKDPELKAICLGMTLVVFALDVACYPQEALVQFPVNIFFYFFIAVINITLRLDKEEQAQKALAI
jgi:O-antigen ligase